MIEYQIVIFDDENEVVLLRCTREPGLPEVYREAIYSGLVGPEGDLAEEVVETCTLMAETDYAALTGWQRALPWIAPIEEGESWHLRTGVLSLEPQTC